MRLGKWCLIIGLILGFFSKVSDAKSASDEILEYQSGGTRFVIRQSPKAITFSSAHYFWTVPKRPCSAKVTDKFWRRMSAQVSRLPVIRKPASQSIATELPFIEFNGDLRWLNPLAPNVTHYFRNLPSELFLLQGQEKVACRE